MCAKYCGPKVIVTVIVEMLYWKTSLGQSVDSIRGWCNTFLFSDEMSDLFDYTRSLPGLYSWDVPGSPSQGIRDDPPEVRQEPREDLQEDRLVLRTRQGIAVLCLGGES